VGQFFSDLSGEGEDLVGKAHRREQLSNEASDKGHFGGPVVFQEAIEPPESVCYGLFFILLTASFKSHHTLWITSEFFNWLRAVLRYELHESWQVFLVFVWERILTAETLNSWNRSA
jgi:hypothetical protein